MHIKLYKLHVCKLGFIVKFVSQSTLYIVYMYLHGLRNRTMELTNLTMLHVKPTCVNIYFWKVII